IQLETERWPFLVEVDAGVPAYKWLREIRDEAFTALKADPPPTGAELDDILHAIEQCFQCYGPDWLDDNALAVHVQKVQAAHALLTMPPIDWQAIGNHLTPQFAPKPATTTERWPHVVEIDNGVTAATGLRVIRNKALDDLKASPDPGTRKKILRALHYAFECFGEDWKSTVPIDETIHANRVRAAYYLVSTAGFDWGMVGDELEPPH
ncbi:MAG: hypothetical protein ACYTGV_17260, partial [Planctomycetota bacterium]